MAYVSVPELALRSSKIDGSDRIQLSDPGVMEAALPRWSPDGTQIVFIARTLNTDWRGYLVGPVPGEKTCSHRAAPPTAATSRGITTDSQALMLFDRTNQQWTELVRMSIGSPSWSHDGQYLYFDPTFTDIPAFFRVRISDHRLERLASLKDIHRLWGPNAEWSDLGPGDSLLVTRNISSPEIYSLDWQARQSPLRLGTSAGRRKLYPTPLPALSGASRFRHHIFFVLDKARQR